MLISIIVPVYNVEPYLNKCLDSIVNQTYKKLEIILIDDGSTDNSGLICDEYASKDNRIIVVHQKNKGLSAARNVGLNIAKGDYIAFVDSDDFIEKDMYFTMYNVMNKNYADVCVCNYIKNTNFETKKIYSEIFKILTSKQAIKQLLLSYTKLRKKPTIEYAVWNKLYRKEIFENVMFPVGKKYEDQFITLLILDKIDKIVWIDADYYNYVQRKNSITKTRNDIVKLKDLVKTLIRQRKFIKSHYKDIYVIWENRELLEKLSILKYFITLPYETTIRNKNFLKYIIKSLKIDLLNILKSKYISNINKIEILILSLLPVKTYKYLNIIYNNIKSIR